MRIIVTFILINLMTTGIPESIYLDEPATNIQAMITSVSLNAIPSENTVLKSLEQLKIEFPVNNELISIKILNERGEVIEKWQGKSIVVIPSSMSFLKKATAGIYTIKGILIDGSESQFLFKK